MMPGHDHDGRHTAAIVIVEGRQPRGRPQHVGQIAEQVIQQLAATGHHVSVHTAALTTDAIHVLLVLSHPSEAAVKFAAAAITATPARYGLVAATLARRPTEQPP